MKNITSRGFAAMQNMLAMATASLDGFGLALRQRSQLDARSRSYINGKMAIGRPANNPCGSKLIKKAMRGTIGAGMHSVNKHGGVDGMMVSPKKDIGKGPAFTLSRRGKSHEFEKREQQRNQQRKAYFRRFSLLPTVALLTNAV